MAERSRHRSPTPSSHSRSHVPSGRARSPSPGGAKSNRKQVGFRRPVAQNVVGDNDSGESGRAREASTGDRSRDRETSDDGLDPDLAGQQGTGDEDSGVAHLARSWSRVLGSSSLAMSSSPEDVITKEQIQAHLAKYPKRHQVQRSRFTEHGVLSLNSSKVS
jgi:hypothetical protein